MTDDIVARLRAFDNGFVGTHYDYCWHNHPICAIMIAADQIEQLRECLQHAIDHVGKWQLFTAEEKQKILAEYEKAVRGG